MPVTKLCKIATYDGDVLAKDNDYYHVWSGMIKRCYSNKVRKIYEDITVHDSWLLFSNFEKWILKTNYVKGGDWHLDKDIRVINNKEYGPSTCLIVPSNINKSFTSGLHKKGKYKKGVHRIFCGKSYKFRACMKSEYYNNHIGSFDTEDEAHKAYLLAKVKHFNRLAKDQSDLVLRNSIERWSDHFLDLANQVKT